jgi:hypothetical protein
VGGETQRLEGSGWEDPIQTTGQTLWYSIKYNPFTLLAKDKGFNYSLHLEIKQHDLEEGFLAHF